MEPYQGEDFLAMLSLEYWQSWGLEEINVLAYDYAKP
jgi:hypothetical protein